MDLIGEAIKLDAETLLRFGLVMALVVGALAILVFALTMAVSTLQGTRPAPAPTAQATASDAASGAEEGSSWSLKNLWKKFSAWVPDWVKWLLKLPFYPVRWVFKQIGGEEKLARLEEEPWEELGWVLLVSQALNPLDFLIKLIAAEVGILCTLVGGVCSIGKFLGWVPQGNDDDLVYGIVGLGLSLPRIPDAAFASQLCSPRDDARQAGVKLVECRVAVTVVSFDELYDAVAGRCLLELVALEL